jgi:hypothetical protein
MYASFLKVDWGQTAYGGAIYLKASLTGLLVEILADPQIGCCASAE